MSGGYHFVCASALIGNTWTVLDPAVLVTGDQYRALLGVPRDWREFHGVWLPPPFRLRACDRWAASRRRR